MKLKRMLSLLLAAVLAFGLMSPGIHVLAEELDTVETQIPETTVAEEVPEETIEEVPAETAEEVPEETVEEVTADTTVSTEAIEPLGVTYTVTYTDGVDDEEIFADQSYTVEEGSETPAFQGVDPARKGYVFNGWEPEVAETVTENVIYVAQWLECDHVWGDPVFDKETEKWISTCTVCGETKEIEGVAKIGSDGYDTLEEAVTAAVDGDVIELLTDVTLSASVTIAKNVTLQPAEGLSVTIYRGTLQPAMFKLSKATLTLSGSLTLDGAKSDGSLSYGSIVLCENGASLVMNEGVTLQNNQHNNYAYGGAVTLKSGNASFIMNGGTITNCGNTSNSNANSATFAGGGAVRIFAAKNYNAQMVMNGGTISNCFANQGGAVGMSPSTGGKASFTMNGGTITGCVAGTASGVASNRGSVVYMYNSSSNAATDCLFTMNGGTITGNTANQYGCLTSYYSSGKYSGCFQLLGGHIYGNLSGTASQQGAQVTGAAGTMHGMASDGSSPFVIGGNAVIEDAIWNRLASGYIEIQDDFTGSVLLYAGYSAVEGTVAAKSVAADGTSSAAKAGIAGRVVITNPDYGDDGNYQYDNNGNVLRAFVLIVDPDVEDQYILDEYAEYTVTYTDGVEEEDLFDDQIYSVVNGQPTPAFDGTLVRKGYVFDGWDPEVADIVTADVTYVAQWKVCEHVWGEPVFDEESVTLTYTCTVCGETKVVNVVAKIESTGEYYETLQDALDAAKAIMVDAEHETQTVTLINDTTESVSLAWVKPSSVANNFNLTIDLAGHTVTGAGSSVMVFSVSGSGGSAYHMNITIADSSAEKTGTVTGGTGKVNSIGTSTYGGAIHVTGKSGDSLTINGGNFVNNTATTGGAIYGSTVGLKIIVNGGTFTGNSAVGGSGGAISAPTVTVNGGVITGNSATGSAGSTGRGGGICVWTTTAKLEMTGGQIYGNTAERYGDDIVFASTSTSATSSPSMKLLNASTMGLDRICGWFVDGYNGKFTSEANTTERYSEDYIVAFESYANFSGSSARGNAIALKAAQGAVRHVAAVAPTCEEEGNIEYWYCENCGKYYSDEACTQEISKADTVVAATGHDWKSVGKVDATCTTPEYTTYQCQNDPHHIKVEVSGDALGHDYTKVVTAPTCTTGGYTTYTCTRCGESHIADITEPTGHSWDEGTVVKGAECTSDGVMEYTCTVCGETKQENIGATGHTFVATIHEPSCTKCGWTTYTCSVCGYSYDSDHVAALGHNYVPTVVEPTCTNAGYTEYTCSVCGDHYTDNIVQPTGHKYETKEKPATCTEMGKTWEVCSVCGDTKLIDVSDPLGHDWEEDWTIDVPATCVEDGSMSHHCSRCDEKADVTVIPATGHTWSEWEVTKKATCTEDGENTRTCDVCGETETEVIPAAGHEWGEWEITKEATCTEDGEKTRTCSVCGEPETEVIPATGHDWDNGTVVTAATCTEDGLMRYTCQNDSSHTYTEVIPATGHTVSGWKYDDTYHWKVCTVCGEVISGTKSAHVDANDNDVCDVCGKSLSDEDTDTSPKTNDPAPVRLVAIVLVISAACIGVVLYFYKKKGKVQN